MQTAFVVTLSGPDRIGFVEEVTGLVLQRGGNVETSRMARLGGEFAVLMLVTVPETSFAHLESNLNALTERGYKVTTRPVERIQAEAHAGWLPYQIEVVGADHEGIIHEIARFLATHGISIETVESEATPAPTSGTPLFAMTAGVVVPPSREGESWMRGLEQLGDRLNLDIRVVSLESE